MRYYQIVFFRRSQIVWMGRYLSFLDMDIPALIHNCLQLINICRSAKLKGETHPCLYMRWQGITHSSVHNVLESFDCPPVPGNLLALRCQYLGGNTYEQLYLLPPLTIMILLDGSPARSFSDRKRARSALLSSRARKLDQDAGRGDQDAGRGTEPSSIILIMGVWPLGRFFLEAHVIGVFLYLSNVTSIRSKSFPETSSFTNLSARS